jgi:hypothetical protein
LVTASTSPDPETRSRAQRLLLLIERLDFTKQLDAFLSDTEGRLGLSLPGWEPFEDIVGNGPSERALFVEMQRAERDLLQAVFVQNSADRDELVQSRTLRLFNWNQSPVGRRGAGAQPPLGSCAAILLVGATAASDASDTTAQAVARLAQGPPLRTALTSGPYTQQVHKLISTWVLRSTSVHPLVIGHKLNLILMHDLREALPLALAIAIGDPAYGTQAPAYRALAVLAVGKLGGDEHIPLLEPLLANSDMVQQRAIRVGNVKETIIVEVRDVVLATLLRMTGQDLDDYKMFGARPHDQTLFELNTLGFSDPKSREAAITKWREWRTAR